MKTLPVRWSKEGRIDLSKIADDIAEATGSLRMAMGYAQRIEARATGSDLLRTSAVAATTFSLSSELSPSSAQR